MAKVLHWAGSVNGESTLNRCKPFDQWTNLSQGTVTAMPEMVGPEQAPVYMLTSTSAAVVLGKRDIGTSYATTDGPVSDASKVWTLSAWVLGYGSTIGRSGCAMDIGDVVYSNSVTLTDSWQLLTATGSPAGPNNYTFADCSFGTGAIGDVVFITQPQIEQRAWRTPLVTPSNALRNSTRTSLVADESGNSRTGALTTTNSPKYVPSTATTPAYWDFSTDTQMITGPAFANSSTAITVAAWFRSTGVTPNGYHIIFSKNFVDVEISVPTTGELRGGLYIAGTRRVYNSGSGCTDGNWHHLAMTYDGANMIHYKDGVVVGTYPHTGTIATTGICAVGRASDATYDTKGQIADVRVYDTALPLDEIRDLSKVKGRIVATSHNYVAAGDLVETPLFRQSLINPDYNTWVNGTSGSSTGFTMNGVTSENARRLDVNPWGDTDIVWHSVTDAVSDASGGWATSLIPVDNTKTYRLSVWIRRKYQTLSAPIAADGSSYLGIYCYNAAVTQIGCNNSLNGVLTTNPYFTSSSAAAIVGAYTWNLWVGVIYPVGVETSVHAQNGVWNMAGTKLTAGQSFSMIPGTVSILHRTYFYYATTPNAAQQFYRPRVDLLDGTEPSLQTLLRGDENPNVYNAPAAGLARITTSGQAQFDGFTEGAYTKVSIESNRYLQAATLVEGL